MFEGHEEQPLGTDAGALIEAITRLYGMKLVDLDGTRKVLVLPDGMTHHSIKPLLDEYLTAPERRKGTAVVKDLPSFIDHAKRFSDKDSAIFADPTVSQPKLIAVLDYHRAGAEGAPRFGEHRTRYDFQLSDEWKAWTGRNDKPMDQAGFAAFIEDRIADLADPNDAGDVVRNLMMTLDCTLATPTKVMELSRGLQVRVGQRVANAINLQSGEAQVNYESEHQDKQGQPLKIPGAFLLAIPVFRNGDLYKIAARLRYRVSGSSISWFYSLYRADRVFDHAFTEACEMAQEATGLPLFVGHPERTGQSRSDED